jgi:hypothetical protein
VSWGIRLVPVVKANDLTRSRCYVATAGSALPVAEIGSHYGRERPEDQKGMSSPGIRDASSTCFVVVRFTVGLEVGGATARSTAGFAVAVSTACSVGRNSATLTNVFPLPALW